MHFQVKSWCSVTYRYFNMSRLPKFVSKNLFICAWKPFVIEASSHIVILQAFLQIYLYTIKQCVPVFACLYVCLFVPSYLRQFRTYGNAIVRACPGAHMGLQLCGRAREHIWDCNCAGVPGGTYGTAIVRACPGAHMGLKLCGRARGHIWDCNCVVVHTGVVRS